MSRHETFLRIKATEADDGERWLTAWATTPSEDLAGDIVSPAGAVYQLPIPLLAYHKTDSPVGVVTEAHVSERGIRVRAKLTRGVRLADELWQLIKDGAVAAVSIGFQALKSKPLASGGLLFERWRWLELSLTPTPCNPDAVITTVGKMQAFGASGSTIPRPTAPAVPAAPRSILRSAYRLAAVGGAEPRDRRYAMYDAAVECLPADMRWRAAVTRFEADKNKGTVTFRDDEGEVFATVHDDGTVTEPGQTRTQEATKQTTPQRLSAAQRAEVGEMLVELSGIISGVVKEALIPLRERIEQLEGKQ